MERLKARKSRAPHTDNHTHTWIERERPPAAASRMGGAMVGSHVDTESGTLVQRLLKSFGKG